MNAHHPVVVALGGNAISAPGEEGNIPQQFAHSRRTAQLLAEAIRQGHHPVITHGNGPQVGNILRRVEIASGELYPIPLEVCVADTQAGMGYMISQCIGNELDASRDHRDVITVVTTVRVDADDPAFADPQKPIGPRLTAAAAQQHVDRDGWQVAEVAAGQFRRIVPSPRPQEILELPTIRDLVHSGKIVICCGGGGIPVAPTANDGYGGVGAVIDKDFTSALLAVQLHARQLVMLTEVDGAYLDFHGPQATRLGHVKATQLQEYLEAGQFAAGSMRPKIESALWFLAHATSQDAVAVIAHLDELTAALDGTAGTQITR